MKNILYILALLLSPIFIACNGQKNMESSSDPEAPERQLVTAGMAKADTVPQAAMDLPQHAQRDSVKNAMQIITGTWRSQEDNNWKLIFTAEGICYQYYQEDLLETDTVTLSNTSPQCGEEVHVDSHTSYLQLENKESKEKTCYEIIGLTENTLSLRPLTMGGFMVFTKQ